MIFCCFRKQNDDDDDDTDPQKINIIFLNLTFFRFRRQTWQGGDSAYPLPLSFFFCFRKPLGRPLGGGMGGEINYSALIN